MTITSLTGPTIGSRAVESASREREMARRIEAGVFAAAILSGVASCPPGVTAAELARVVADGQSAHHQLVRRHIGLVWFVARPAAERTGLDRADLVQEGIIGLLEAITRFDPDRGRFATFALVHIRGHVGDATATALGRLGLPAKRAHSWWQVRAVAHRLSVELGREATVEEVAEASGRRSAQVAELLAWEPVQALPADTSFGPALPAVDRLPDTTMDLMRGLSPQARRILAHRFGLGGGSPQSYAAIARTLGVSEATVRRRERAALQLLRLRVERSSLAA